MEKYRQQPFVLLGVNLDPSRASLQRVEQQEQLNWRSWWDGSEGALVGQWGVEAFPTLFLLDHRGVVRYKTQGVPTPEVLEKKIEELLQEARKQKS